METFGDVSRGVIGLVANYLNIDARKISVDISFKDLGIDPSNLDIIINRSYKKEKRMLVFQEGMIYLKSVRDLILYVMSVKKVYCKVTEVISAQLEIAEKEIIPNHSLVDDLKASPADVEAIFYNLQEEHCIIFPGESIKNICTVGDLIRYVIFIKETFKEIADIISRHLKCKEVSFTGSLKDDLGANSVDIIRIFDDIEKDFHLIIFEESLRDMRTVGDIVKCIVCAKLN